MQSEPPQEAPAAPDRVGRQSCETCRRRKVRCDKKSPCTRCSRGGHSCSYRQTESRPRRARNTTMRDVSIRISELEKAWRAAAVAATAVGGSSRDIPTLSPSASTSASLSQSAPGVGSHFDVGAQGRGQAVSVTSTATSPAHCLTTSYEALLVEIGPSSHYFNEILVSRAIEQERRSHGRWRITDDDYPRGTQHLSSPFNPMGLLSSVQVLEDFPTLLPPRETAMDLWKAFVDQVDPCLKVVHIPTAEAIIYETIESPGTVHAGRLALCFAIYYVSTVALEHSYGGGQPLQGDWLVALQRFKTGLERSLALADFLESPSVMLLQALALYLAAIRSHNSGRSLWVTGGLVIRAAQSIGLHRDGRQLGLSPFEAEVRRRLWWHLISRDSRAAEDHGFYSHSPVSLTTGSKEPLNLDDTDLCPAMRDLPSSKYTWTRMSLSIINIEISRAYSHIAQVLHSTETADIGVCNAIMADCKNRIQAILDTCNAAVPLQRLTLLTGRFLLRKLEFIISQQVAFVNWVGREQLLATEDRLKDALCILRQGRSLAEDDLLRPFRWSMHMHQQYHLLTYIIWHICVQPRGQNAREALGEVETYISNMEARRTNQCRGSKWYVLQLLRAKAAASLQSTSKQSTTGEASSPIITGELEAGVLSDLPLPQSLVENDVDSILGNSQIADWSSLIWDLTPGLYN